MSEREPMVTKLEVEVDRSAQDDVDKQEKDGKSMKNGSVPTSTILSDIGNVPAITLEGSQHEIDMDADADADADSEAETLIQSPAKKRNSVVDGSTVVHQVKLAGSLGSETGSIILTNASDKENAVRKRKRSNELGPARSPDRISSHRSSPLSSPVAHIRSDDDSEDGDDASDGEGSVTRDNHQMTTDRIKSPRKRRRPPSEITASTSSHKRSKRNSVDNIERRETRSATYPRPSDDDHSPSPEIIRREHRRGASTQSTPHEFERRKRGRPPNIHTRRNRSVDRAGNSSDESEPRTSRSRPHLHMSASHEHDTMSPVKDVKTGPRKWKDKNGRTYLARACNNNDLEAARARFAERPEDLNMEDNAGNTPLQIAALEGFEEIVEFLLSKGAEVNARNVDKDTPLLDAVENGHVEVVKLLLKFGANPRLANAKGDEPYEMVHPEDENYAEIRELLAEAREKDSKKIAGIDTSDFHTRDGASSRAASAASPRDSPPIGPRSPPSFSSRRRTGRSESTRNDLLWQANTQENLAKLASKGDSQGVASILSILEKAETEAVIAAAKAGHEEVLQLLIAMGRPNPDPDPVRGPKMVPGYNTPILAAIGRGHPDVVKLLANQAGFNPTRKFRERTYFELAEERSGPRWEEEFNVLKQAYDKYAISKGRKPSSPRRTRDTDKSKSRTARRSSSVHSARRPMSSPKSTYKTLPTKTMDGPQRELRKTSDPILEKRRSSGNGDATETSTAVASDADLTIAAQKKTHRTRRSQSDLPSASTLDHEPTHKRRRLVTGKEHRSRQTIASSSDHEDTDTVEVKVEELTSSALKRPRNNSASNPLDEADELKAITKKRRTMLESSPEEPRTQRMGTDQKGDVVMSEPRPPDISMQDDSQEGNESEVKPSDNNQVPDEASGEEATVAASVEVPTISSEDEIKHETPTVNATMADSEIILISNGNETAMPKNVDDREENASDDSYSPPPAVEPPEDGANEQEEVDKKAAEEEAAEEAAEEARLEAEREANREAERIAAQQKQAQDKAAEELRLQQEAEEKKCKEEEAAAQRRQEEEQRELERQEAESRRRLELLEQERKRIEALPIVLAKTARMIDEDNPEVRSTRWLSKNLPLYSVRTKQLDPGCETSVAEEEWIPSFQVAGLLTTKDLSLSSFTSFTRKPVDDHQRLCLWRVARLKLSYSASSLKITAISKATELERIAEEKFMAMAELFWVKLSDFLDQVARFSYLADLNLSRQAISLKSYEEILGTRLKNNILVERHAGLGLSNGVSAHTNGENGTN